MEMKFLVAFVCIATVLGAASSQVCSGKPDGSFIADDKQCNSYYSCVGEMAIPLNCSPGYHYNAVRQICEQPSQAGCIKCPSTGFRNLPVAGSCDKFVQCFKGVASDRVCPGGLMFDASWGQCSLEKNVKC
ncbi:peritrophin-44-like [Wyeomyia smithii]|uniref:peritrophin-44-like n=1 Tax=Wyeomyia smithii TaxID=174621 RepID=UPI002467BC39|nr:peritrophin-44-like [Wyeomyia smithii]